jgi:DNA-binding transcriptional ArsR family regulator
MESALALVPAQASAVDRLSALAQTSRLNIFRLLVRIGPEGLRATDIAERLAIPPATLSTHLRILTDAGLLTLRAQSRERVYAVRFEAMRDLVAYLLEDCCQGSAEVCTPLAGILTSQAACCAPSPTEKTHEAPARSRRR